MAVAINVGANSNLPGFRGPVYADGRFEFIPIPEREPVADDATVPTYGDLGLSIDMPTDILDRPVHLDPEFEEYPCGSNYTYGDEHGVKAAPIADLAAGDLLFFYATLDIIGDAETAHGWSADWGAFLIGMFTLETDPLVPDSAGDGASICERVPTNAHCKRARFDARVVVEGSPSESRLFDRAIPLSSPATGIEPNAIVTEWSSDSGQGPWWRRPLRFDATASERLLEVVDMESYPMRDDLFNFRFEY